MLSTQLLTFNDTRREATSSVASTRTGLTGGKFYRGLLFGIFVFACFAAFSAWAQQPATDSVTADSTVGETIAAIGPKAGPRTIDPKIEASLRDVVAQLTKLCPVVDAGDQKAFDQCREQLFGESKFKQMLSPYTLWGRQRDPAAALKNTKLTQFGPDVLAGLYVPLFMFDGTYKLTFNERENMYLATLNVVFRNRLQPGQFPYPFWHDADKWNTYENARSMLLWINPQSGKTRVAQFSTTGDRPDTPNFTKATLPVFDGKWVWTDADGKTQPAVTLFDGLFKRENPYKEKLSQSYRDFAMTLRESQCFSCHVPNNPNNMSRLVLLQTPAHAASEIKRVLKEVRNDGMPVDKFGVEQPLDAHLKKTLLEKGGEFERFVDLAREWEKARATSQAAKAPEAADPVGLAQTPAGTVFEAVAQTQTQSITH